MLGPPAKSLSDKKAADKHAFSQKTLEIYRFLDDQKLELDIAPLISVKGPDGKLVPSMEKLIEYAAPRKRKLD